MSDIWQIVSDATPYAIAYIAGHGGSVLLNKIKQKLDITRKFVDVLDDAVNSPQVTDAQYLSMWNLFKSLFQK